MKIFDPELKIASYAVFEEFTKSSHDNITPMFRRSPFCMKADDYSGSFKTLWDLAYNDKNKQELFLDINVHSSFKFKIENKKQDLKDFIEFNNDVYRVILSHIKENCFGYYEKLPQPPPFPFIDGFDVLIKYGYYS